MKRQKRILELSDHYWEEALKVIPAGTQTLSKSPLQSVMGIAPKYIKKGEGSHVIDVDGNDYIDYSMGGGPVILGHNYPAVSEAIKLQIEEGNAFIMMHPLEVEVANLMNSCIPCSQMVRFGKNGSDATYGTVRVARGFTGRDKIASSGYHGWHDWSIGKTERNKGIPKAISDLTLTFPFNDIESIANLFKENKDEIAAVIIEPALHDEPKDNYLNELKQITHENGAVLIFDEVWTGFRWSLGGAQEYYDVTPDLACFGKAMGNGVPISSFVGKKEIMMELHQEVFFSSTFGGECLGLAASKATINEIRSKPVIEHIKNQNRKLARGYNEIASDLSIQDFTECIGPDARIFQKFNSPDYCSENEMKSIIQQELYKNNIIWKGYHGTSFSHNNDDIEQTIEAFKLALHLLKKAIAAESMSKYLEGEPIGSVFRSYP